MPYNRYYGTVMESQISADTEHLTPSMSTSSQIMITIPKPTGLSLFSASVFIVGVMAGAGVLALPKAIANTGWSGLFLIFICCFATASFCVILAKCWLMVEEIYPECRSNVRNPFPTIGEKAVGKWMKTFCAFTMDIQLFGGAIVFLLLSAELSHSLISNFWNISVCRLIVLIGLLLCPLTWLKSPHNFWPIAYGAMACTAVSCVLVVIVIIKQAPTKMSQAVHSAPTFNSFLLGFSTMLFAYGGCCALPTFQNDMRRKEQFPFAVMLGFITLLILYYPLAIGGFIVYGDSVNDNVLQSTESGAITTIVNVLMDLHLFCAFLIVINPLNLDLENRFGIPHNFNWKRVLLRTFVLFGVIFFGASVPKFGKILNLVGSSTVSVQTFVLPPWFYYNLCNYESENYKKKRISKPLLFYFAIVMIAGTVGGILATYSSLQALFDPQAFTKPCYWKRGEITLQ